LRSLDARRLQDRDVETLNRDLPLWDRSEYARRLLAQTRLQMVQAIAWDGPTPVGRGMVLFPEHDEYSDSAARERCAEIRDVSVAEAFRRRGVATAVMRALEDETGAAAFGRIGLAVGIDDDAAPARALYERLAYRHAHGPFVISTTLHGDDGPFPVSGAVVYLVKDL
jgi:ribosomal protein S18 acetylase RimI-like enzyme